MVPVTSASCGFDYVFTTVHANNHFVEDELQKDRELAQQIMDASVGYEESFVADFGGSTGTSTSSSSNISPCFLDEQISILLGSQVRSSFHEVPGGLMPLLRSCLDSDGESSRSIISGHVDHYQSVESEDSGWGCGWRNIQMLSSHLLRERRDANAVLFGGSGFVPDIPSLQRWLEIAWEKGFDVVGSNSFQKKIYGHRKWIGTTECSTLFRSFGLRARVVDFDSITPSERQNIGNSRGKGVAKQLFGPMDKFVVRSNEFCDHDLSRSDTSGIGHQILVDWVWNYFMSKTSIKVGSSRRVIISEKTPLYFQHDGHSRTIVGIQMQKGVRGSPDRYCLLVLDPAHKTKVLERSLRDKNGWQKMIKRGVHTLKKPQYQLCYVDPGTAHAEEMEQLKTIDSILVRF
ncbi:Zinc finger with UFM1-specific peptidase domain protein [Ananas comosus]|uniref:Zinc finger with UFM1-specific peptidase domain protein n=1 Tax=Ananas comosus TaxID=4615 RepID=A0A199VQ39_ANACO|nr:Zinc finger with UFM1-specific peptidase domain protein [Ananas comosus]